MRLTIEIDEKLLDEAMKLSGVWTQRAAIELALKRLIDRLHKEEMLSIIEKREVKRSVEVR